MKQASLLLFAFAVLAVAVPLHAQGGCVNSPENPTAVLAVVGSAGVFFARNRRRASAHTNSRKSD